MPIDNQGKFTIIQKFFDAQYIKSSWITSMLKDIEKALNDVFTNEQTKFNDKITLPQMTNVITNANDLTSAVSYGTTSNYNLPVGAIIMFSYQEFYKNGYSSDFAICDGNGNTPDLREYFDVDYFYIKKIT